MKIRTTLSPLFGLGALLAVLIGCGTAPASQSVESVPAPQTPKVEAEPQAPVAAPTAPQAAVAPVEEEAVAVEVGYKVGMQVPEFGMSLLDGSKVTSAKLVDEGKPVFIYFHATW